MVAKKPEPLGDEAFIVAFDFHHFMTGNKDERGWSIIDDTERVETRYLMDKGGHTTNKLLAKPRETLGNAKKSLIHLKHLGKTDPGPKPGVERWGRPGEFYHENQQRHWIDNIRILRLTDHYVADVTPV